MENDASHQWPKIAMQVSPAAKYFMAFLCVGGGREEASEHCLFLQEIPTTPAAEANWLLPWGWKVCLVTYFIHPIGSAYMMAILVTPFLSTVALNMKVGSHAKHSLPITIHHQSSPFKSPTHPTHLSWRAWLLVQKNVWGSGLLILPVSTWYLWG